MKPIDKLISNDDLTNLIKQIGVFTFEALIEFVRQLPYGRTSDRSDLSLVIKEHRGTCSSKHALLKLIAEKNSILNVNLILCIFKMNQENTPAIKSIINQYGLNYIPEAHCYIEYQVEDIDVTFKNSDINHLKKDILLKENILPHQVIDYKIQFHKTYLQQWIDHYQINYSIDEIWQIREKCIEQLHFFFNLKD